jgi:hypothetical protein
MMRRIIVLMVALVAALSSVAAVSAFEAHVINVTAHVENALTVETAEVAFGTVFPEEWFIRHRDISLSESFQGQNRVQNVDIKVYAECKWNPATNSYYKWLGEALWLDWNGAAYTLVGPIGDGDGDCDEPAGGAPEVKNTGFGGTLSTNPNNGPLSAQMSIGLDTPVFLPYYNEWTDVCDKPRPNSFGPSVPGKFSDPSSGTMDPIVIPGNDGPDGIPGTPDDVPPIIIPVECQAPTWLIPTTDDRNVPAGVDLGLDLKIQVTAIY